MNGPRSRNLGAAAESPSAISCSFGQGGFLDHQDTVANITLFAKEVMPRLRELNPEPTKTAVTAE